MISNLLLECQSWDRYKPVNTLLTMERVSQMRLPCPGQKDREHKPREPNAPRPTKISEQGAILLLEGQPSWEGQQSFKFIRYWWLNSGLQHALGQGMSLRHPGSLSTSAGSRSSRETLFGNQGKPYLLGKSYFDTAHKSWQFQLLSLQ